MRHLDPAAVSALAKSESRNREVRLPPISVYRWWARRTAAVQAAVVGAAEVGTGGRLVVADPFAGGGVIPLVAAAAGHRAYAQDLNPWAAKGLAAMLGLPKADALREAAAVLHQRTAATVEAAYGTTLADGRSGLISHTFRVATACCTSCGERSRLYPHALVSMLARRERGGTEAFLACPAGHLFKGHIGDDSRCPTCEGLVDPRASYTRRRVVACACGHEERLEQRAREGDWKWEVVLVERTATGSRELALPTKGERNAAEDPRHKPSRALGVIPDGQETRVLLRHGFTSWSDLYPRRQRALLEQLLDQSEQCSGEGEVVAAVKMAIVGSAEMAGLLSRWDRYYLKSFESMAGHRFNFTTLAVEPNVWGTVTSGRGTTLRRLAQLVRAAEWMERQANRPLAVLGPLASDGSARVDGSDHDVVVVEGSSERMLLADGAADLVLTDPPYHDDVQYSELSLPLRAWAGLSSQALVGEAVVNGAIAHLVDDAAYGDLLVKIFRESARVLKVDGHLVFSYANRSPAAWIELLRALDQSNLRAVGCEIVHSENETDQAKRGVRACSLDLLLDLVPLGDPAIIQHRPRHQIDGAEADFLRTIARWFLKVGNLPAGWRDQVESELRSSDFLSY